MLLLSLIHGEIKSELQQIGGVRQKENPDLSRLLCVLTHYCILTLCCHNVYKHVEDFLSNKYHVFTNIWEGPSPTKCILLFKPNFCCPTQVGSQLKQKNLLERKKREYGRREGREGEVTRRKSGENSVDLLWQKLCYQFNTISTPS